MTKEELNDLALEIIRESQKRKDTNSADLAYLLAYNDGVLAFLGKALQKAKDKEEATCEKAKLY